MSLPEGWVRACELAEDRLKNYTPIDPINATYCLSTECPAAKVLDAYTQFGQTRIVYCMFSRCLKRYPTRKEMRFFK